MMGKSFFKLIKLGVGNVISIIVTLIAFAIFAPLSLFFTIPSSVLMFLYFNNITKKMVTAQGDIDNAISFDGKIFATYVNGLNKMKEHMGKANFMAASKQAYMQVQYSFFNYNGKTSSKDHLSKILILLCFCCVALIVTYGYTQGTMSTGTYLSIIYLYSLFYFNAASLRRAFLHANLFNHYLKERDGLNLPESSLQVSKEKIVNIERIDVKGLGYVNVNSNKAILKDISFSVIRGVILGIVGSNNSGKTVLSKLLMQYYPIKSGSVIVNNNINIKNISNSNWNELAALVPQEPYIFSGTILENIALSDVAYNVSKVISFVKEFQVDIFFQDLPKREQTYIGDGGAEISFSQKQVISIVRSIYASPQFLILDEPSSFLDDNTKNYLFFLVSKLKEKACIILLTSDIKQAEIYCENIVFI